MREAIQGLTLVLLIPMVLLSFTSLQLILWVLVPRPLIAIARSVERGRGWCLAAGALGVLLGVLLIGLLSNKGQVADALAACMLGIMALNALTGVTAVTALLGKGVMKLGGYEPTRAGTVVVGAFLFGAAGLLPVVGWILALYLALIGYGGALLALLRTRKSAEQEA